MKIPSPTLLLAAIMLTGLPLAPLHAACGGGGGGGGGGGVHGGLRISSGCGSGNRADPEGRSFKVSITPVEDGKGTPRNDRIVFGDKTLAFAALAEGRVAYTWRKEAAATAVSASVGEGKAGGIVFTGTISANVLKGTITVSAKDGSTTTYRVATVADARAKP